MWADGGREDTYQEWSGAVVNGGLFLGGGVGLDVWAPLDPRLLDPDRFREKRTLTHPVVRHLSHGVRMSVFLGMALVSLVGGLAPGKWVERQPPLCHSSRASPQAIVTYIFLALGFIVWYPACFQRNRSKLLELYATEVRAWCERHPDQSGVSGCKRRQGRRRQCSCQSSFIGVMSYMPKCVCSTAVIALGVPQIRPSQEG